MKVTSTDTEVQNILRRIENTVDLDRSQVARFFAIECGKYNEIHLNACLDEIIDPVKFGSEIIDMKVNSIKAHTSLDEIVVGAILQYEIVKEAMLRWRKQTNRP